MKVVIGSDHGGFGAKAFIIKAIQAMGHEVVDFGCHSTEAVDYPDVAQLVAEAVVSGRFDKGVLKITVPKAEGSRPTRVAIQS